MNKYNIFIVIIISLLSTTILLPAHPVEIGTTYVDYATAYSNGHKIAIGGSAPSDGILVVYNYKEDSIHLASSNDGGATWHSLNFWAASLDNAHFPSVDVYDHYLWVVWEVDSAGIGEIFLANPLALGFPQNISQTPGHSTLPAIAIDTFYIKHIVWQDNTPGNWEIYYYSSISNTLNLSNNSNASDIYPSISIFGNEVHVIWERYDATDSTYSIVHRYLNEDIWSDEELLAGPTDIPLHHPSLDFSHGEDSLSAAWEDSSSGNLDAYFYEGNGGSWPTSGNSRYPVMSTMGKTWSYLYWEDNSDGVDDIYARSYYINHGWGSYKFREAFEDEDMHYPSTADCYVIWTQGDSAPYKVMFANEGLPCGVEESEPPASLELKAYPNPFTGSTTINISSSTEENFQIKIYDVTGAIIRTLPINERTWDGRNSQGKAVASGIYILKIDGYKPAKVVKLL